MVIEECGQDMLRVQFSDKSRILNYTSAMTIMKKNSQICGSKRVLEELPIANSSVLG